MIAVDAFPQRYWEDVREGESLPPIVLEISYKRVIMNTATGRDYMRGHHDPEFARQQGVRTIYMNTFFHQAFVDRIMTDWAGPAAFIARRKIAMRASICAGDTVIGEGRVARRRTDAQGRPLVDLAITIRNEREICCVAEGTLLMPTRTPTPSGA